MSNDYLPRSGQTSFIELTHFIGRVSELLGAPDSIEHRVVAYKDKQDQWIVYASGLYVGYAIGAGHSPVVRLGPLFLVSHRGTARDANTPDRFRAFIHSWQKLAGAGELISQAFGDQVHVDRVGTDQGPSGYPCWRNSLYYTPSVSDYPPPIGPFFDQVSGRFAERAADAAVNWLNDEVYHQGSSPSSALRVVIADPRAYMTRLTRQEGGLHIAVLGTRPDMELNVVVQTVGYGGIREAPLSARVLSQGGSRGATIRLDRPFQHFRALLFGTDGEVFDEVNEAISQPSARGYELFGTSPSRQDIDLSYTLATGESDAVECKEWMPTDVSDGKAIELLESVCAFGNGHGGSIYIGVSKQLEVKGTDRPLRVWRLRADRHGQRMDDLRAEYAKMLRARIADGITPSVPVEIDWIEYAGGEDVCRIQVRGSGRLIHSIIATNDIYVRRGANNRKARPEELTANRSRSEVASAMRPM